MLARIPWLRSVAVICTAMTIAACPAAQPTSPDAHSVKPRDGDEPRPSLTYVDMPRNGLTREALSDDGAKKVLAEIATGPLSEQKLSMTLQENLTPTNSSNVLSVLEYVISCALDHRTTLTTATVPPNQWSGEVGLCSDPLRLGNWENDPPTPECLEVVSSCVLARVNALHKRVIISARPADRPLLLQLQSKVPVETEYRECGGTPIRSFQPCPLGTSGDVADRDCGWTGKFVGSCMPGDPITVQAPTTLDIALRVCKGIYGCDHEDSPPPAVAECPGESMPSDGTYPEGTPWYAGVIHPVDINTIRHTVTFTCPGADSSLVSGYFSVMMAPATDTSQPTTDVSGADVVLVGDRGTYPSPEQEVFTFREGAFFGNLFDPVDPVDPAGGEPEQMLVGKQYACYSDVWSSASAHLTDRLCAGTNACFDNTPVPCFWIPGACCNGESGLDEQNYLGCKWGSTPWEHSITVFLNHPCDLAASLDRCRVAYGVPGPP